MLFVFIIRQLLGCQVLKSVLWPNVYPVIQEITHFYDIL